MTIESAGPTPAQPVAAAPTKNGFQRLAGALFAPAETFADVARRPDYLVPLVFLILVSYATVFVILPLMDMDAVTAQQEEIIRKRQPNVSDADIARMTRVNRAIARVGFYAAPALQPAIFALIALVLFGAFRLMGGEGRYGQAFSATLYAWMPQVLKSIVVAVVVTMRGSFDPVTMPTLVKSNPAFLVDVKEHPVLFSLLSSFDLFNVWTLILFAIGFAALSKFPRGKSAAIVAAVWLIFIVIKLGGAALTAGLSG